jgi:hypothetical protein
LAYFSTLKIEVTYSSETLVDFQRNKQHYTLEDKTLSPFYFFKVHKSAVMSWDSSVIIATSYRLDGRVRFLAAAREFSQLDSVQTNSGTYPASHPMGTGGSSPG